MHELTRRTYLQELGIDSYTSRKSLPGAGLTRRLLIKRQSQVAPAKAEDSAADLGDRQPQALDRSSPISDIASSFTANPKKSPAATQLGKPCAAPANKAAPVQAFNVAAIVSGDWLWLEELTHGVLSRDQVHLIQAMARALGAREPKSQNSQFDWPIHNNAQLDLGTDAARAGLAGFVQRKFEQHNCRGLIVLGRACEQRLAIGQLRVDHLVSTVSSAEMLANPLLKRQAWDAIAPLARHS